MFLSSRHLSFVSSWEYLTLWSFQPLMSLLCFHVSLQIHHHRLKDRHTLLSAQLFFLFASNSSSSAFLLRLTLATSRSLLFSSRYILYFVLAKAIENSSSFLMDTFSNLVTDSSRPLQFVQLCYRSPLPCWQGSLSQLWLDHTTKAAMNERNPWLFPCREIKCSSCCKRVSPAMKKRKKRKQK